MDWKRWKWERRLLRNSVWELDTSSRREYSPFEAQFILSIADAMKWPASVCAG